MSDSPLHIARKDTGTGQEVRARSHGRWPRRFLVAVNVFVLLCLVAVGVAYGYVRYEIGRIATAPSSRETPEGHYSGGGNIPIPKADLTGGLKPENILLIGNQTRQGLTPYEQRLFGSSLTLSGTLADIIMILHLDPATDTASLVSIPRDLFAPMPAGSPVGSYQKIDAALNDGKNGPDNLIAAIQQDWGIPINHFIELNFNGLINVINAIGGINVYFPDPVFDAYSLLNIPTPGCHHLNGFYALTLVRSRHLQYEPPGVHEPVADWPYDPESDLARIVRTHTFLKIVADKIKKEGLADPFRAPGFISAIVGDITVDSGLKSELVKLVLHYRHVNISSVAETTLPTAPMNNYYFGGYGVGDVLFPVEPADMNVIRAWDPSALPAPVAPKTVNVQSITGSYEAAVAAGQALTSDGLHVASTTTGTVPSSTTETYVLYHQGQVAEALDVMKYLSGAVMMAQSSSVPAGTVEVQLGNVVSVTSKLSGASKTSTTTGLGTTTATTAPTTTAPTTTSSTLRASVPSSSKAHVAPTTTTVPTPGGIAPSSATGTDQPWDPRACPTS